MLFQSMGSFNTLTGGGWVGGGGVGGGTGAGGGGGAAAYKHRYKGELIVHSDLVELYS